ncbi:uncharacterized protein SAPINGB_P001861 [Magnusiomyces paraingens]|uniref:MEMO1 family protein n=1 Tax=Magnusiomyces paraingens TaxID=2606893 RepID=A0A5E8BGL6_9ASCO|nr:uncharacterized protein SAPINGB_P001861 [Saprochaete ingens]VVT48605.1 unnamed protein product [Saprochaete ingens]
MSVRAATHAGSWFSGNKTTLSKQIDQLVAAVKDKHPEFPIPGARVLVGPHAGYTYSGKTLAETYSAWDTSKVKRVFILGPSHHVLFRGAGLTEFAAFDTPLGKVPVDTECVNELLKSRLFTIFDEEDDEREHSIELHLPFLFKASEKSPNGVPSIVPIVISSTTPSYEEELGKFLSKYVSNEENAFVISSDFCHWGLNYGYTAYTPSPDVEEVVALGKTRSRSRSSHPDLPHGEVSDKTPIYKSIEYLDRKAMEVLSTGSIDQWNEYMDLTENTICGRRPFSSLLHCLNSASKKRLPMNGFASEHERDTWGKLQWIGYAQSGKVHSLKDYSVSYTSGYAVI